MGADFTSETDAEVIAHLISHHMAHGSLVEAVRAAYAELEGHYAFVAMSADEPDTLVGRAQGVPADRRPRRRRAVPRLGDPRVPRPHARRAVHRERGDRRRAPRRRRLPQPDGTPIEREVTTVDWDEATAEKGGYETFMLKEIHEQADAVAETIADRTRARRRRRPRRGRARRVALRRTSTGSSSSPPGTSFHAGLIGRYAIEEWARIPVDMDIASEWRYRNPIVSERELVIGITQSGETADTLAAMRLARERGAKVLAVTNVVGSQATRDADGVLYTRAGLEVSVAATKTFVCQVAAMYLLALRLAELRGTLPRERIAELVAEIKQLPDAHRRAHRARSTRRSRRPPSATPTRTSTSTSAATSAARSRSRAR